RLDKRPVPRDLATVAARVHPPRRARGLGGIRNARPVVARIARRIHRCKTPPKATRPGRELAAGAAGRPTRRKVRFGLSPVRRAPTALDSTQSITSQEEQAVGAPSQVALWPVARKTGSYSARFRAVHNIPGRPSCRSPAGDTRRGGTAPTTLQAGADRARGPGPGPSGARSNGRA